MSGIVGKNLGRGSGVVTATPVGADTVSGASIVDDAIDSEHYADGSIDNAHIADDAIDSEHYADGSIDNAHIADDAIDSEHYVDGSIDNAHIADNAIDSEHYVDGSIDNAHIADNAIDSEHYADGSIDNAHIADDAIDSEHYADGSIDEAHIADNAVTLAKMAGGTDGNIISFDASGDPVAIATGDDGQVLTSTGAGSPPAFEDAAGGEATYVQFPATQVASADANRLDDYEEGTWTPALKHSSGSGTPDTTYTGQTGHYVKVGQMCWIFLQIKINSLGTGHTSGFQGAPFTSSTTAGSNAGGHSYYNSSLAVSPIALGCDIASNDTGFTVRGRTAAAAAISSQAIFGDGARFDCTFVYRTSA